MKAGMKAFGFAGYSGAGKTTLLEALIPRFVAAGLRVSLLKHAHHHFDIDRPGKDSFRLREAGCAEVLLVSGQRWALMHELRGAPEPSFEEQLARFSDCDLVLVEGFKSMNIPKLEVHRPSVGKPLIATPVSDGHGGYADQIVAIATDEAEAVGQRAQGMQRPILPLDQPGRIAEFILRYHGFKS